MSAVEAPSTRPDEAVEASPTGQPAGDVPAPRISLLGTVWAPGLASAGGAAVLGSLFAGGSPVVLAVLSALAGAGMVAFTLSGRGAAVAQWGALPAAGLLATAAALLPGGTTGTTLPTLVADALLSGGLSQPPVPFDPGWRFLLVGIAFLLGFGTASVASAFGRPVVGVGTAAPVTGAAALALPADAGPLPMVLGVVGVVGGLALAHLAEVSAQDPEAGIRPRRVGAALGAMVGLVVGLLALAQVATTLLPDPSQTRVVPPQRPPVGAPQDDVELFRIEVDRALPWRLGVLDVYDDNAWKTPPFDLARYVDPPTALPGPGVVEATFEIAGLAGRAAPGLARPVAVEGPDGLLVDPRTDSLRTDRLLTPTVTYTVRGAAPATTAELDAAGPPSEAMAEFLEVPAPPAEVVTLLAELDPDASDFGRLQAVRQAWYDVVVAAGAGDPVDVPPGRVAAILRADGGGEASPWEIVAGEALLARWVGVPSRLGYGWYAGDPVDGGWSVRPRHGAVWLEAHFEDVGWVPLVGKPPRAKASLSDAPKNDDPAVRPTDELALITHVPIRQRNTTLLFEVVRHWVVRALPVALLVLSAIAFAPVPRRAWRRRRRRRWAARNGPAAEVLVAYGRLRDRAWDLNIGHPAQTPLEFAAAIRPDDEHHELAWLVTRVVWGDLREDAGEAEVDAVRRMSGSVERRLVAAQPAAARIAAAASRASLRTPWASEADTGRSVRPRVAAVAAALLAVLSSGCVEAVDLATPAPVDVLPATLVPTDLPGFEFRREPAAEVPLQDAGPDALVDHGQVFSIRVGDTIEGSLQVVALRPGAVDRHEDVRDGLLQALGGGRFEPIRVGGDSALAAETAEQRLLLWFSPSGDWYQLLVARRSFDLADDVLAAVLAAQRGQDVADLGDLGRVERPDPRRGLG